MNECRGGFQTRPYEIYLLFVVHHSFDQCSDLRRVPFLEAYGSACHIAFSVNEKFHGSGTDPELRGYLALFIHQVHISEAIVADMLFDSRTFFLQVDRHNGKRTALEMTAKTLERRQLLLAPWSPCGPETEKNNFAAVIAEPYILSIYGWQLKIRHLDRLFIAVHVKGGELFGKRDLYRCTS